MTEKNAWICFCISLLVMSLGFISPVLSFPLQCLLVAIFVAKCDVKLIPSIYVLCLNKYNFLFTGATTRVAIHFMSGFNMTPVLVFKLATFAVAMYYVLKVYAHTDTISVLIWLSMSIPCAVIAFNGRMDGVSFWPMAVDVFLCFSLYIWGFAAGRTWETGCDMFVKQMMLILFVQNGLEARKLFYIFTFAEHPMMVCFAIYAFKKKFSMGWKVLGVLGSLFSFYGVFLANYYLGKEMSGYTDSAKIGSTFTRVFCILVATLSALWFYSKKRFRASLIFIPIAAIIASTALVIFASCKAASRNAADIVTNDYQGDIVKRFQYKLIGDRGAVWAEGFREMFNDNPYVFKRLRHFVEMQATIDSEGHINGYIYGIKVAPHNQVLTLLARFGWWLGLGMVILLLIVHLRAFKIVSYLDIPTMIALLAPHFGVVWSVGTTGQTVVDGSIVSNGLVTMIAPGIMYGYYKWKIQRTMMMANRGIVL